MEKIIYNQYSQYLKKTYGSKVYKLPVSLPVSCPNREHGSCGCTYCGVNGTGFENLSSAFSVGEQLIRNKDYIGRRYKAQKFIAYFQSFTNTYLSIEMFEQYMQEAVLEDIVEIAVSTRPDCIRKEYLEVLKKIKENYNINITIELGLQTANYNTLLQINRGHTLAEYIDAVFQIKQYNFQICTHLILNLPWDTMADVMESAKLVSACRSDFIKLHALYIEKGTIMAEQYTKKEFTICTVEEYKNRVITFLELLSPEIVIQRLIGRAPKENTLFANWNQSWWKIRDEIEMEMKLKNSCQGIKYDYLNGSAVRNFFIPPKGGTL